MSDYVRHPLSPAAQAKLRAAAEAFAGRWRVCDECEKPCDALLAAGPGWFKRRQPVRLCRACYDRLAADMRDACPPDEGE